MRWRRSSLLWPLLVGALSLAVTAWLWRHDRQTEARNLRSNFEFGLRQATARVEERLAAYEQMLRGARGLFDGSDAVTHDDFSAFVGSLSEGADFAGLRSIAHAPLRAAAAALAPLTDVAPALDPILGAPGVDLLADPAFRTAMQQARDSGSVAITAELRASDTTATDPDSGFALVMALYRRGPPHETVADRRANLVGWVLASFRIGDMMSSLYGEGAPGLAVQIHDGADPVDGKLLFSWSVGAQRTARFEAHEFIGFAGHTWTLTVRSSPVFEQRFSSDSPTIIAVTGGGLSLALALLTWQLVTARDRADAAARAMTQQLRDNAGRYRRIVETAAEGIWMIDADGRTSFVNPKMLQLLGRDAEAVQGRPWTDFMDADGRAAVAGDVLARLGDGQAQQRDIGFARADGGTLWATVSVTPIHDADGRYAGALAMVTDITERRQSEARRTQLESQLRQSQKMEAIGTLAGGIAHDFNNLLAAILGNVALVQQLLGDDHPAAARLAQIGQAGARGRSLVRQIVAFSRQQPQERVAQPLRPLLEETLRLLRSALPALVDIELRVVDASLWVQADATQLQQVLMNLCTNAWHAMTGGSGRIVIGLDAIVLDAPAAERLGGLAPGRHAHVQVVDDGCGMDEATRARVFEPFFTTKPVGQGTGLGLSVVHGIVRSHGGAITVASAPGRGSSFDMYFPLTAPAAAADDDEAPPAVAAPAPPPGQGQHVLYLDDDPVMVLMVQALLQRHGWRVTAFDQPRLALARIGAHDDPVDLVVTDFNMPEVSGLDVAAEVRRIRPGLPVILSSGFVSDALRQDAQRLGVRHVMQKEYTLEQLAGLIDRVLSEAGAGGAAPAPDPAARQ